MTININKKPSEETLLTRVFKDNSYVESPEMSVRIAKQTHRGLKSSGSNELRTNIDHSLYM